MTWVIGLLGAAALLRITDAWYYRDAERVLRHLNLVPQSGPRESYYASLDPLFAPVPFLFNWCEIIAVALLAVRLAHPLAYAVLVIFVAGRFRALQEVSHTATHFGLCRRQRFQWALSNVLFQYP